MTTASKPPDPPENPRADPPLERAERLELEVAAQLRASLAEGFAGAARESLQATHRAMDGMIEAGKEQVVKAGRAIAEVMAQVRARERVALAAAFLQGLATLPPVEREWAEEEPERLADLDRRVTVAHDELWARLWDETAPAATEGAAALVSAVEDRRRVWCAEVDALAASDSPEGRLVLAALQRLWLGERERWVAGTTTPEEAAEEEADRRREEEEIRAGRLPPFLDAWHLSASGGTAERVAEVEALALWPEVRDAWRTANAEALAARYTLAEEDGGARRSDRQTEGVLRLAVEEQVRRFVETAPGEELAPFRLLLREPDAATVEESRRRGIFLWDERVARALERLGAEGSPLRREGVEAAKEGRSKWRADWLNYETEPIPGLERSPAPWRLRWRSSLPFSRLLALVLWRGEVRERLERDARNPPALSLAVVNSMGRAFYEKDRQISFLAPTDGTGSVVIVGADGEELARTAVLAASELEDLQRGASKLRSYTGHLAIRGFVERGWAQARAGSANASILGWEGGLSACAHDLGAKSKKAADELRDILQAGQAFRREWAGGEVGGLWTYSNQRQAPGRRAYLEVRLGRPLMPGHVHSLGPRDRTLVPLPPMPPHVAAERTWAPQAAFQLALVRGMVDKRTELVKAGGARFTPEELARMARAVGLAPDLIPLVLDRWTHDGTDGLACLERVGRDRYHLPDNADYRDARAFLEAGGLRSLKARQDGEKSASARSNPRRRRKKGDG